MKNVLQIMGYAAPYKGNFISSMEKVEKLLKVCSGTQIWCFPEQAKNVSWMKDFEKKHNCYFLPKNFFVFKRINIEGIKILSQITMQYHIDSAHIHFLTANLNLYLYSFFNRKVKLITSLHNHYQQKGNLRKFKNFIFKKTNNIVIGVSKSVSESTVSYNIPQRRVVTIPNAIVFNRLDDFQNISIKCQEEEKIIMMFGYPFYRKGVDIVIKALESASLKKIRLLIISAASPQVTKEQLSSFLGQTVPDWITVLPAKEDVASYYNAVDLFVSAGREEGLCYSPLEAAYCKPSVICSHIPGNPLDIPFMQTYDVEDVPKLREIMMEELYTEKERKKYIKEQQRQYVLKKYNISDWAESIIKCY